ncbi:leucine-rich repeat protein kinase family protein [Actinidia rufa]|uniref:Leucine-rich repeat protein kinase family protein n=1 Tax=Actinidia rufa TaxID=165716 RepID=A0A7J0GFF7_9ERIC|nr:leucine-rich repeat protein kinase family protein [Actinidia rufa]
MMGSRVQVFLLVISIQILLVAAQSNEDFAVLKSLKDVWDNTPPNWEGPDPCGNGWVGIWCNNSRVTAITLASIGLTGKLSGDLSSLSELQTLDLSYNKGLTGPLPVSIGSLKKLTNLLVTNHLLLLACQNPGWLQFQWPNSQHNRISAAAAHSVRVLTCSLSNVLKSLNSNSFSGSIPPEIGYLSSLYWLDLADNKLSGRIPVSDGTTPGLDMLVNTKHFHFGKNQLSGTIPPKLFSPNMSLIHVLFENNNLSGSIPLTLGLVQSLEVLRLDRNLLTGPVPSNLNNLVHVNELILSNNQLSGSFPNLTGMNVLNYV